ncbi:hypothetical protein ACMX2H_16135 [Arthrobacter sulfonylureivorans]
MSTPITGRRAAKPTAASKVREVAAIVLPFPKHGRREAAAA